MTLLVRVVESRGAQLVIAAIVIAGLSVATIVSRTGDRGALVDPYERARADAVVVAWNGATRGDGCPRRALRASGSDDGAASLAALVDPTSSMTSCLRTVAHVQWVVDTGCPPQVRCASAKLSGLTARPDVVAACTSLYDAIDRVAHASAGCSPLRAEHAFGTADDPSLAMLHVPFAVRLQIAPLVAKGEIAVAAQHVIDAIRLTDDYGRGTFILGAMESLAGTLDLATTLDELLVDPRLTADDARAVARDLDVLLGTTPSMTDVFHREATWAAMQPFPQDITHDRDDDRALQILGMERWVHDFDTACAGASLRVCVDRLRSLEPRGVANSDDFERVLQSDVDDRTARDQVVEMIASLFRSLAPDYALKLGDREIALLALRMQAELRTVSVADCRDPDRRHRVVAAWLRDGVTLGDELEPTLQLPAWRYRADQPRYVLRCIAR